MVIAIVIVIFGAVAIQLLPAGIRSSRSFVSLRLLPRSWERSGLEKLSRNRIEDNVGSGRIRDYQSTKANTATINNVTFELGDSSRMLFRNAKPGERCLAAAATRSSSGRVSTVKKVSSAFLMAVA